MPRKNLDATNPVSIVSAAAGQAMARLTIDIPVNLITVDPTGKFINLPWGSKGTFEAGGKVTVATITKGGRVTILTKSARKESAKEAKPAVDLLKHM